MNLRSGSGGSGIDGDDQSQETLISLDEVKNEFNVSFNQAMNSFQTTFFQQLQQQAQQQRQQAQGQADLIRALTEAVERMGIAPGGQGPAPGDQLPPLQQRPQNEAPLGIINAQEQPPPPKERRPSIPVRYGYINRAVPSREQVSQPMAPRPVALKGSMPRRKLDLTTTDDILMKKVEHPKFPTPPIQRKRKTWRRRELRRRAKARKELQNAAMEEEVTALAASLEKCHFKKDVDEEVVLEGMFKVTDDMTFEYLVGRGLEGREGSSYLGKGIKFI
ncbi:hypothetical protein COLO4_08746 [Corchorus olitorius]|uniref:Uncharacterized protein n=1 Tax=Corchorus olitorius TaxID=93759 RepID=A0A1R3KES0_9ROSI|nr:hypothetical protein COLO4_08746 [Corchorus olitorius]